MKHKSIGERLKRAGSQEVRLEIAEDWARNWQEEMDELIADLEQAVREADYDLQCQVTGQIKAVSQKRFDALPRLLRKLTES